MHILPFQKYTKGIAKIAFVGDIMCENTVLDSVASDDPFFYIKRILLDCYTVGNLETTLSGFTADYPRFSSNDLLADYLKDTVQLLFTANNHSLDYGTKGLYRTIDVLEDFGIDHIGTFKTDKFRRYFDTDIQGHSLSFLNFTQFINEKEENIYQGISSYEEETRNVHLYNEAKVKEAINLAKKKSDFVVIGIHCDDQLCNAAELSRRSTRDQRRFLRTLIDAGADLVIGGHPHYFQGGEVLEKGKAVVYSLGNFFTNMWDPPKYTVNCGCIMFVEIDSYANITYSFLPIATVLHEMKGFYYVIPLSPLEGGAYNWLTEKQRKTLLEELSSIRETLQKHALSEAQFPVHIF